MKETDSHTPTQPPISRRCKAMEAILGTLSSKRGRTYAATLVIMLLLAMLVPFANIAIIYPAFTNLLVKGVEEDAARIGRHMQPPSLKNTKLTNDSLTQRFYGNIYKLENDYGLMKVKIYSHEGEVIYSTNPSDIGHKLSESSVFDKVTKGEPHSKLITKNKKTTEGEVVPLDVIETYVPSMRGDTFLGAFEMYYDVTKRKAHLDRLAMYSRTVMFALSFFLFLAAIFLLFKEVAHQRAKDRADKLKQEVERITRHDIKSPLISILTGIEYLEQFTEPTKEQVSMLADMRVAANTSMEMINRSMDLYKMESGTYQYEPGSADLITIIRRAVKGLQGAANSSGVQLTYLYDDITPPEDAAFPFEIEETLCFSLLSNLIKNAIEASGAGDLVTINLTRADGAHITIHNPTMVPVELQETFFEKYSTAGKKSGTGLGTYSARLITKTMGGTITMQTSAEDGTTLTVSLPPYETDS